MAADEAPPVPPEGTGGLNGAGRRLPRAFYARPSTEVAIDLLGRIVVRRDADGVRTAARIVETEAYSPDDPASHAFRGPTSRNAAMFGAGGHLYVYFIYGMHHCMNVVTGGVGEGSAVLLRAAQPLEGIDVMRRRRGRDGLRELCSGPARLCEAFGVDRTFDGTDLVRSGTMWLAAGVPVSPSHVASGPRIGISVGTDRAWRFHVRDDPFVSRTSRGAATRRASSGPRRP